MKNKIQIKGIALGVMFALTTLAFAGEGDGDKPVAKVSVFPYLSTDYSVISVNNPGEKSGAFVIKDSNGETLHQEYLGKSLSFQKVINFANLEDGEYTIVLKVKGYDEIKEPFLIKDKQVVLKSAGSDKVSKLKSFANIKNDLLSVSHLAFEQSAFKIKIANDFGEQIFEKRIDGNKVYSGKFDISKLPSGDYRLTINSEDNNYSYAFSK